MIGENNSLKLWIDAFLKDRRASDKSPHTIRFYKVEFIVFLDYCHGQGVDDVFQITPDTLRDYMLYLKSDRHRNTGGVHAAFRAIRAFLNWWEVEAEPDGWKNPLRKVRPPKLPHDPLPPVEASVIGAMYSICGNNFYGTRDRAILLCLGDTGARAREFVSIRLEDVDVFKGIVFIRHGKGDKPRATFLGKRARRVLRKYLKARTDNCPYLWITDEQEKMAVDSLRQILKRRANQADVPVPSPHMFRRYCAKILHRNGVDILSIARILGHSRTDLVEVYVKQETEDLEAAHAHGAPIDSQDLPV